MNIIKIRTHQEWDSSQLASDFPNMDISIQASHPVIPL